MKPERCNRIYFAWRRNLIYPIQLFLYAFLRKIDSIIIDKVFHFSGSLLYTFLMFFAEFVTGLIIFFYQQFSLKKKNEETQDDTGGFLIYNANTIKRFDSQIKKIFLIFVSGYYDFIEFILSTYYLPKFQNSSGSLETRLAGILIIVSALFFYYILKLPILRHQFFSLLIVGICLIITIISEYLFQDINIFISYGDFTLKIFFIIVEKFFHALLESIERYVVEYNHLNYFKVLSLEGLFGLIITLIYSFSENSYIAQLSKIYSENSGGMFTLFIFLLIVYTILCGGKNAFRVVTNRVYSPMTTALTEYFLNPIYLIIGYIEGDFVSGGSQNFFYFLFNFIITLIMNLCGCVFNDIIILFFCGFERETHDQISRRSTLNYLSELSDVGLSLDDDEDDDEMENVDTNTIQSEKSE